MAKRNVINFCFVTLLFNLYFGGFPVYSQEISNNPATKNAVAKYEADLTKLENQHKEKLEELQSKLLAEAKKRKEEHLDELVKIQEKAMETKNLDLAVEIRNRVEKLKTDPILPTEPARFQQLSLEKSDFFGKKVQYYWEPVNFLLSKGGEIVRVDGKSKSDHESYWRINPNGQLEFLDSDQKTVTKSFSIIKTPQGHLGFGSFSGESGTVFLRLVDK